MSVTVYSFKTIDVNKIKLSVPVKFNKKYSSYLVYYDEPLFIQTPKLRLSEITSDFEYIFEITESPEFIFVIRDIENRIKDLVHTNSTRWFDNKQFSKESIESRLISLVQNEHGKTFLKIPFESKNLTFFNQFKNIISKEDLAVNSILTLIIKFPSVSFSKLNFSYDFVIEQGKVYEDQSLQEYSIIDSDDNSESSSELSELEDDGQTYIPKGIEEMPFF